MTSLREYLKQEALDAVSRQAHDGSMAAGHNGPYFHPETPLRNTSHWLVLWSHAALWSGEKIFHAAASRALSYVLDPQHRPNGANWLQRTAKHRDRCNGLIGAAWVIESLTCAARCLDSENALIQAEEVFSLHPFDERYGMWKRVEVDGTVLPFDRTFNHQLWFAASASRLAAAGSIHAAHCVHTFLEKLPFLFSVYRNGLIVHRIRMNWWDRFVEPASPIHKAYVYYDQLRRNASKPLDGEKRDIGYHAFNLHGFAKLHEFCPGHEFWNSRDFRKALEFARSESHRTSLEQDNRYAYPYNPVGFEMALMLQRFFPSSVDERVAWVNRQISVMTRMGTVDYGSDSDDPITAKARLYEAVELDDVATSGLWMDWHRKQNTVQS
jgi:hypothetical protein